VKNTKLKVKCIEVKSSHCFTNKTKSHAFISPHCKCSALFTLDLNTKHPCLQMTQNTAEGCYQIPKINSFPAKFEVDFIRFFQSHIQWLMAQPQPTFCTHCTLECTHTSANKFLFEPHRHSQGNHAYVVRGLRLWNSLPESIKIPNSVFFFVI